MTTIGFIGSGNIGSNVARVAVAAGYDVVMSNSRGPETLGDVVADLGDHARAGTTEEASDADLVVLTVPLHAYDTIPAGPLAGRVVIDTGNYYPERDGHIAALDTEETTTSELVQQHLDGSRVVKAFGNIYSESITALARPAGSADRSALAIAGDDADARAAVAGFLDDVGFDTLDAGPLAEGWRWQRDTAAYATPYAENEDVQQLDQAAPCDAARLEALLDQAVRYADMPS